MSESTFNVQTFYHAGYVAFAFGCLLFGALAFRQVLDNMEVRRLRLGEDLASFVSPIACIGLLSLAAFVILIAYPCYSSVRPTVYAYAFPLVLSVQALQLALRMYYQRVNLKTHGLVVRSVLFGKIVGAPYNTLTRVEVQAEALWIRVSLHDGTGVVVVFRIFRHSSARLLSVVKRSCNCPVHVS
jgi:hypothetical protein